MSANATARVTLTLEIDVKSHWGKECSIGQVHDQARDGAIEQLVGLLSALRMGEVVYGGCKRSMTARLVGDPQVVAVLVEAKRGSR